MQKPILLLLLSLFSFSTFGQSLCTVDAEDVICNNQTMHITYNTEVAFSNVDVCAFTIVNGVNVPALLQNKTNESADIIFLEGGNAQIVVKYILDGNFVAVCNQNVSVIGETPFTELGKLSDFVDDQTSCQSIDIPINMFISCAQCPFFWTLNNETIELTQDVSIESTLQVIEANLSLEGVGSYQFCQSIMSPDSSCFVSDCITIDIVDIMEIPKFSILDEEDLLLCSGIRLHLLNETEVSEDVFYIWTIQYDTIEWKYTSTDLDFDFDFPGEYTISLQFALSDDTKCVSSIITKNITIEDAPIIPISCSSVSCSDSIFTYRSPVECDVYLWEIDESLGEVINVNWNEITVRWFPTNIYTETQIKVSYDNCDENICGESIRKIELFPNTISIDGPASICDKSSQWYTADLIPGALYNWSIERIDSISEISPSILLIDNNRIQIAYNSFIGSLRINVIATLSERDCITASSIETTSFFINASDDLCIGALFRANLLPATNENVIWTLQNSDIGYFNQKTLVGNQNFLVTNINSSGIYDLNMSIPSLDFECTEGIPVNILEEPLVELIGPRNICPGDSVFYTLANLGGNDIVEWTIFQNGTSTQLLGNEIGIVWIEGGEPYTIKVRRSTEVMEGQICKSDFFIFTVNVHNGEDFMIAGDEVVCYDGVGSYQVGSEFSNYLWRIDPPQMGTIIEGDSTASIIIQWHYNPNIPNATIRLDSEICDSTFTSFIEVIFEPYVPNISISDSICLNSAAEIKITELDSYQSVEYFVDGIFENEDKLNINVIFQDTGYHDIRVKIVNPNGCPGVVDSTESVYVIPVPSVGFELSQPLKQCPKEDFEDVNIVVTFQDESAYYVWMIDGDTIQEGLGSAGLYEVIITKEIILSGANFISVGITLDNGCTLSTNLGLDYFCCPKLACQCIELPIGFIEYITPLECNLVSFGGFVDLSTVLDAEWIIPFGDTIIRIPILDESDMTIDSFLFPEGNLLGPVGLGGTCLGQIIDLCTLEVVEDSVGCPVAFGDVRPTLFYPRVIESFVCNEDLSYEVTLTERQVINSNSPYNFNLFWTVNGIEYEGDSIIIKNVPPSTDLNIELNQCSLDGTYCCSNPDVIRTPDLFDPQIILPNGSCENDLWLFTLDEDKDSIFSVLWDFGDESGSTLFLTEKGFLDNLIAHTISVDVTDILGCRAVAEIEVITHTNNIDGEIIYESEPCAKQTKLLYIENSDSEIISYEWSYGFESVAPEFTITNSGIYTVTVTDINGCTNAYSTTNILVNQSFIGGMRFRPENCGVANVSISANSNYEYSWFVDDLFIKMGNSIQITEIGTFSVKVISASIETGESCDSLSSEIIIHPLPQKPDLHLEKLFCDPFIVEISVNNYDAVTWNNAMAVPYFGPSIQVSQNGLYSASVEDENGCRSNAPKVVNESNISFANIEDLCIHACREQLDSLSIEIPGTFSSGTWQWISVDSLGLEFIAASSIGNVTPLIITEDMYDYVRLVIEQEGCTYQSQRVDLDIVLCDNPNDPDPIECELVDVNHANCGLSIFNCLLSYANGGPKFYFEGEITIPSGSVQCNDDTLSVSMNNGEIDILHFTIEEQANGDRIIFYATNIYVNDYEDYLINGSIFQFSFCDENGIISKCLDFHIPYRSCEKDFECLVDYEGISAGPQQSINVNYCLNLSDVVQENCVLTTYQIEATISGNDHVKQIYSTIIQDNFNQVQCIQIPISYEDFTSGTFNCIELIVIGDCPNIVCSEYQCGFFGGPSMISNEVEWNSESQLTKESVSKEEVNNSKRHLTASSLHVFPNPHRGQFTVSFEDWQDGDQLILRNTLGQIIFNDALKDSETQIELAKKHEGVLQLIIVRDGLPFISKNVIMVR